MIFNIEKEIREKINNGKFSGDQISFLKYSTPISGKGIGNKVIFFVFKNNAEKPIFVVKTVRSYRDAEVIRNGHKNLDNLNHNVKNTDFSSMFPKSVFLYDDGYEIWSLETVCLGLRPNPKTDLDRILDKYSEFSKNLLGGYTDKIKINKDYGLKIIAKLQGPKESIGELILYLSGLWGNESFVLPKIPQHGDLTLDNILVENGEIMVIDCDLFGDIALPGFDVFHLLSRGGAIPDKFSKLKSYYEKIGLNLKPEKKLLFVFFLHELLIKKDYILNKNKVSKIIEDFESEIKVGYTPIAQK